MKKRFVVLVLGLLVPFLLMHTVHALSPSAALEITGPGIDIRLSSEQMLSLQQTTFSTMNISSSGHVTDVVVTGFSLTSLLGDHGLDMAGITSINLIASDGYVMSAPAETYADADVYIMLNRDGDDLEYPRSCLPDQRSMYWVKNLAKIELTPGESAAQHKQGSIKRIGFFREALSELGAVELNNRGNAVRAYPLAAYFETFGKEMPQLPVTIIARDGHVKTEVAEIFLASYVTFEAEADRESDLPLYFSEDMSLGMRVKQLDLVLSGEEAIFFGSEIPVSSLFELVGMAEAESYRFVASDGFLVEIPAEAIPFGTIYTDESKGYIRAKFDGYDLSDVPGGGKVKYLIAIESGA